MATFKTLNKDNTEVEVIIAGARSSSSNQEISSTIYANYDSDTSNTYRLAEITVRDHFGNSASNGFGDMVFRTNSEGVTGALTNNQNRMILTYDGNLGINNMNPAYRLDVDHTGNFKSNMYIRERRVNAGQPAIQGFTPVSITESNVYTRIFSYITNPYEAIILPKTVSIVASLYPIPKEDITSSNFSYWVRAYDSTHNVELGKELRSNAESTTSTFSLSNVNLFHQSIVELQVKKNNGGLHVSVDAVNIGFV